METEGISGKRTLIQAILEIKRAILREFNQASCGIEKILRGGKNGYENLFSGREESKCHL